MELCGQKPKRMASRGAIAATAAVAAIAVFLPQQTASAAATANGSRPTGQSARQLGADDSALAEAVDTGQPAEVLSRRTETSQVFANPDGSFTQDAYVLPQFARQDNKLVPIDTRLEANPDGTLSPKATETAVRFSSGGDGPLATIVRDGRSMSWSWPQPLPSAQVDEDTVTFANVLTDVDLKLRAGPAGFTSLFVVKTPQAAADPALKQIHFDLDTDGVEASTDESGNLTAVNPAGQEVFTAPSPLMWDSGISDVPQARTAGTSEDAGPPPPTDEFEPGHGAQQASMEAAVTDGKLILTPNQDLLTGEDTQYPVLLDPSVSGSRYAWTIAYKTNPTSSYYNGANFGGGTTTARAGYENKTNGLARSYFRMNTGNLWSTDKVISSSKFTIKNTWSWSCTKKPIELWHTEYMSSATTWNHQPKKIRTLDTVTDSKGWGSDCPAGKLAFDTTPAAEDAAKGHWNTITLALKAGSETDVFGWKKFDAKSALLSTTYNTRPNVPSGLDTIPSTKNSAGCGNSAPYGLIGNTDLYLTAKGSDPNGGTVKVRFNLWATGHHPVDDPKGVLIVNKTVSTTSGTVAKLKVTKAQLTPYLSTANGNFSWKAQTQDASLSSAWVPATGKPGCRFVFDPTRPSTPPGVKSVQFPDGSDGWPAVTGNARTEGTFTLSSGGVADVTKYEYWTDWNSKKVTVSPSAQGGSVNVKLRPLAAGNHTLYVNSIDRAGNVSDRSAYIFYANSPGITDKPGDLNGDGNTDMYGIRTDGTLWFYPGQGNGQFAPYTVASDTNFNGASITHRGDWTDDGYEDLIAAQPGADGKKNLYVYPNNGLGYACTARGEEADGASRECSFDRVPLDVYSPENNHWKNADQILAIGDVDGPLDVDADGTPDVPGHTDILVKEGDHLWLYYGSDNFYLDDVTEPVLIGDGAWANYEMVAPGDVNGDGKVDMVARQKSDGRLRLYTGTGPAGEGLGHTTVDLKASGWDTKTHPLFTSGGDSNGDGKPDLFATSHDTDKGLCLYPSITPTGIGTPTAVGTTGWLNFQALS
ncbi:FG-GAP-like repeat-containing protein [Streptomyces sp. NPDC088726]|uniref:FG-GAP-like repeat-containing protein n=1 Tax=Streptomyces sp. NPDC088726 TaxID=3365874 RepID=UPI00382766EA